MAYIPTGKYYELYNPITGEYYTSGPIRRWYEFVDYESGKYTFKELTLERNNDC